MKKIFLTLVILFASTITVLAADNIDNKAVLTDIKITNFELAPFDGELEINYELVPNDVDNKEVTWSISGLQTGVTAEIDGSYKTNKAVGTIVLKIKNANDKASTLKLNAKSGNISKTVNVEIENQTTTEDRYKKEVVTEIEKLIVDIKNIDAKNEKAVEKAIDKIETMLKNEEVKKSVKASLLEDFDEVKNKFEAYKNEEDNGNAKIVVIAALAVAFLFGLYMIFKDNKPKAKKEIKKVEPKKEIKKEELKKVEPKKVSNKKKSNKR